MIANALNVSLRIALSALYAVSISFRGIYCPSLRSTGVIYVMRYCAIVVNSHAKPAAARFVRVVQRKNRCIVCSAEDIWTLPAISNGVVKPSARGVIPTGS